MSMLITQVDKLRWLAEHLDERERGMDEYVTALRDAADLILELRDNLQCANEAVRDAENDESMAWYRVRKAEAEVEKLRELCRDMFTTISWCDLDCYPSDNKKREYADRMRELGVGE